MRLADPLQLLALVGLLVGGSGCWAAQNGAASAEYARQVSTASLRVAQLEAELARSLQRIEQLEEVIRMQGQTEASRLENIDQVVAEVTRLRGDVEVQRFELLAANEAGEKAGIDRERRLIHGERRLHQIESFLGIKPPPPPTDAELGVASTGEPGDAEPTAEAAVEPEELPPTAAGKLDRAVEHMQAGRQGVARSILQKAIADHPRAQELDEVRYRYAETFLNEEKWRPAILEFKKVIDSHADSPWACWAYYRQGEAMEQISGIQDARVFYSGATQGQCRNSDAAKAAKKKM